MAEDVRFFYCLFFFGALLSGGVLGAMGAAPGSICPRFFFIFFSTSGGVLGALGAAPGSICPCLFSPFFPRQEECWGPHQARIAPRFFLFFFSTSGGVGRRRQLGRVGGPSGLLVEFMGHHMHFVARTHGDPGCLTGLLFFQAFASSRRLKATVEGQEGEELQLLEGETRCCR